MAGALEVKMEKSVIIAGIFGIIAIVGIVLLVNSTITGQYFAAHDYYVRPSGMQMRVESGVMVLQSDVAVNQVCRNSINCNGLTRYTCCNDEGTSCVLPTAGEETAGRCPSSHRSRCQCREDYVAGLFERYG
jgi:hypothetical protein